MEQRFRNYSSDSVGSDGVFIEDSYQGVLKAMDHRKGRVNPCVNSVPVVLVVFFIIKQSHKPS